MSIFKCKMCGGTIEFEEGATVGVCVNCGTRQTLPKCHGENISNLFNRANTLRLKAEFDKAAEIYERIVQIDDSEAEAHWGLVLCKYGVEYVDDPKTFTRIPTCHRACYESVTTDEDYRAAIDYSDMDQQAIYKAEARAIEHIQRGILEIAKEESPFDVFICYKETDENGRRTVDSTIANDIYYQLIQEGLKVFYSAVTLEDKIGQRYEPYIFAALQSAKVMLVIGTNPDYFDAVWVRNEWSRFLKLMKEDHSKLLIPCYRDMDPYDLPEEFAHIQAQDMSKIGFISDVVRGIKKVMVEPTANAKPDAARTTSAIQESIAPLLERTFLFLEDHEWQNAADYCEKILDIEPKCADAYLAKLMVECKASTKENLSECQEPFTSSGNYQKAIRFGNNNLVAELDSYIEIINSRNEAERLQSLFDEAIEMKERAETEFDYLLAQQAFEKLGNYRDAQILALQCEEASIEARNNGIYQSAQAAIQADTISGYREAIKLFGSIPGWKDSSSLIDLCMKRIEDIEQEEKENQIRLKKEREEKLRQAVVRARKIKKITVFVAIAIVVLIGIGVAWVTLIQPSIKYKIAVQMEKNGNIDSAIQLFLDIDGYKDSADQLKQCYITKLGEDEYNRISSIKVGDEICFGNFEQNGKVDDGKEHLEWTVLQKEGMKVLLLSSKVIACKAHFQESYKAYSWENSNVRMWLNSSFVFAAFSEEEKVKIVQTETGKGIYDDVFCLSVSEMEMYYSSQRFPTGYATRAVRIQDYWPDAAEVSCDWWLRTKGEYINFALVVDKSGYVSKDGRSVNYAQGGIRPAMWVDLSR